MKFLFSQKFESRGIVDDSNSGRERFHCIKGFVPEEFLKGNGFPKGKRFPKEEQIS